MGRELHPLLDLIDQVYGEVVVQREPVQDGPHKGIIHSYVRMTNKALSTSAPAKAKFQS